MLSSLAVDIPTSSLRVLAHRVRSTQRQAHVPAGGPCGLVVHMPLKLGSAFKSQYSGAYFIGDPTCRECFDSVGITTRLIQRWNKD